MRESADGPLLIDSRAVDTARLLLGKPTSCVGRDRELGLLAGIFEECVAEQSARAALVVAPAGAGKSRVRQELLGRMHGCAELEVWTGPCEAAAAGSPYAPLAHAIRHEARIQEGEPIRDRKRKLAHRICRHLAKEDHQRVTIFLGELIGVPFDESCFPELRAARENSMVMGDQMRRAWEDWAAAECAVHPVALILEDLHAGVLPTVRRVDATLRNLADRPFFVLALARPEIHDVFPRLWAERGVQITHLGALPKRACERMVTEALGDVGAEKVDRLVARAQGNPFFLEELIRAAASGADQELPETVLGMVQARVERLDGELRRVLRAASVFGEVFWRGGVLALLDGGERASVIDEQLAALVEREVLVTRPGATFAGEVELAFRHALVRDTVYAMLTKDDLALGHRLAGQWLESEGDTRALVLAEHFEHGADPVKALARYRRAAEDALTASDLAAVLSSAQRAIACGATGAELGMLRALELEAHAWRGEWDIAATRGEEALRLLPAESPSACRSIGALVGVAGGLRQRERVPELIERLLSLEPPDDALPAYLWSATLAILIMLANFEDLRQVDRLLWRVAQIAARSSNIDVRAAEWQRVAMVHAGRFARHAARGAPRLRL